jgi:xanthine/CO dehydrogenase XdhC/CoxF family maturation factor
MDRREPAVVEAAARVIAGGDPVIVSYDLEEDSLWGLGIGCSGAVDVRIERIEDDAITRAWLDMLDEGAGAASVTPLAGAAVTGTRDPYACQSPQELSRCIPSRACPRT